MSWALILPAVAAIALGMGGGFVQRRLRPQAAVPILTSLAVLVSLATGGAVAILAIAYLAQVPWLAERVGWCRSLARSHDAVPSVVGLAACASLVLMVAASARKVVRRTRMVARLAHDGPLEVIPTDETVAFAVPGRPGHIVVSSGMLLLLNAEERRVLFAHEGSHLRHRHHRYLELADLAIAAVPVLRPLCAQLRFATERWADEDAAAAVGDRRLVAHTIARAALGPSRPPRAPALALARLGVAARVEALLAEPVSAPIMKTTLAAAALALTATLVSSTVQLHHMLGFAAHVCRL